MFLEKLYCNMKIKLTAFGIAKDILQTQSQDLEQEQLTTIGQLKSYLCQQYPDFTKLQKISFAVNEEYQNDNFALSENDEVIIIPPVSGG